MFELASNTKLFTTAAALWKLGADYEFRTTLIANGQVSGRRAPGRPGRRRQRRPEFLRPRPSAARWPSRARCRSASRQAGIRQITRRPRHGRPPLRPRLSRARLAEGRSRSGGTPRRSARSRSTTTASRSRSPADPRRMRPATISTIPSFPAPAPRQPLLDVREGPARRGDVPARAGRRDRRRRARAGRRRRSENIAVDDPPLFLGAALRTEMEKPASASPARPGWRRTTRSRQPDARRSSCGNPS